MLTEYEERLMDAYFDPGLSWERYNDTQEQAYKAWYDEAVCGDCEHCLFPGRGMYTDPTVAFCHKWVEGFIHTTDTPAEWECEAAEPR